MAKKSASLASASAASAAPGTSIITPRGGSGSAILTPRRRRRRATCSMSLADAADLADVGDHRQQDAHRALRRRPAAWPRAGCPAAGAPSATGGWRAAPAPGWRRPRRAGERLGQLVAADIERAQRHRSPAHAAHQPGMNSYCSSSPGRSSRFMKQEFGAHQAEARRRRWLAPGRARAAARDWRRGAISTPSRVIAGNRRSRVRAPPLAREHPPGGAVGRQRRPALD